MGNRLSKKSKMKRVPPTVLLTGESDEHNHGQLTDHRVPLTVKKPELLVLLKNFLKGRLIESVLVFFDDKERLKMNLVSKKIYYEHMPVMYTTILLRKELIVRMLEQGIPQEALQKYSEEEIIKKYAMLDNSYAYFNFEAFDWCKDLSTGEDVEYKDCFTDQYGFKYWGMVRKGTTVKHGFVRYIDPKNGMIFEAHFKDDKLHGYYRVIHEDGKHNIGFCKDDKYVGVHIVYDASNKEINRLDYDGL